MLGREQAIKKLKIIDGHCDSLLGVLNDNRKLGILSEEGQADFPRLIEGGVKLQFFAVFIESRYKPKQSVLRALEGIEAFHREIEENNDLVFLVDSKRQLEVLFNDDRKIGALLAIEGGEALGGQLSMLGILYRLGVRCLGLTWNQRNEIADGVGIGPEHQGLTEFGRQVIERMNELGMLIDLAHIAEKGFWDTLKCSRKPVIVTHANCRSLCDHPRNLSDQQLRALAEQGGCLGITFVPQFVDQKASSLEKVVRHIQYAVQKMGEDHVGLGSDFDGMDTRVQGLEEARKFPFLAEVLKNKGFSETVIEKIMGTNWLRILREQLK